MKKAVKDPFGIVLKYPDHSCKICGHYPCFEGIENCVCDFGKYGCSIYSNKQDKVISTYMEKDGSFNQTCSVE